MDDSLRSWMDWTEHLWTVASEEWDTVSILQLWCVCARACDLVALSFWNFFIIKVLTQCSIEEQPQYAFGNEHCRAHGAFAVTKEQHSCSLSGFHRIKSKGRDPMGFGVT
eukprot:5869145-Amphidinium_carterae.1